MYSIKFSLGPPLAVLRREKDPSTIVLECLHTRCNECEGTLLRHFSDVPYGFGLLPNVV